MARTNDIVFHIDTLPRVTRQAFEYLSKCKWLADSEWYLAGGTALALQIGHRESVDLDFFTQEKNFELSALRASLPKEPDFIADSEAPGTLYGRLHEAKISFISYPFFVPKEKRLRYGSVAVLHERDIAVMKIIAVSQRGKKRDFIDLYWYARNREPLLDICLRLSAQYPSVAHDYQHIIKALLYFVDAEEDVMPKLFFDADWEEVKAYFRAEVPKVARVLLRLG